MFRKPDPSDYVPLADPIDEPQKIKQKTSTPLEVKTAEKLSYETDLSAILTQATINEQNAASRAKAIVKQFNVNVTDPVIGTAQFRSGYRLEPYQFMLAHKNKVPELGLALRGERLVTSITGPYTEAGVIRIVNQNDTYIEAHGSHVINVPQGKFAKAWSGNTPMLLNEGTHVIHDSLFKFNNQFVVQSENYIEHGNLHILRVQPGRFAKITINGKAHLLEPREEPYVFDTALFRFDPERDYVDQLEPYIHHGTRHILRVPAGSVAKVWVGNEARLLEAQVEPYVFDDPLFRVEKTRQDNKDFLFCNTSTKLIEHGSQKRINPGINEVAILSNGEFIDKPKLVTDRYLWVVDFLNTSIQTLEFPSEKTKKARLRDDKDAKSDELSFDIFTTNDSVKVGVKLLVAIQIANPTLAMKRLGSVKGILDHIEAVVTTDMGKAIQQCSSKDFLNFYQNKPLGRDAKIDTGEVLGPVVENYQDTVKKQLAHDLEEYGITLIRMNVQESKMLDKTLADEMGKQSLITAKASAEGAAIHQIWMNKRTQATQEAEVNKISQQRANQAIIDAANAELEAAKLRGQAKLVEAEAINKAAAMQGELFNKYPQLAELRAAEIRATALSRANFTVTSVEFANLAGVTLFGGSRPSVLAAQSQVAGAEVVQLQKLANV